MAMKVLCNMCGKRFNEHDHHAKHEFHKTLPYGSKYDDNKLDLDFCIDCFDKLLDDFIIPNCKIHPLIDLYDEREESERKLKEAYNSMQNKSE